MNVGMKLGRPVGLVSGWSNPTAPSNRQTKSVGRGLMSNPEYRSLKRARSFNHVFFEIQISVPTVIVPTIKLAEILKSYSFGNTEAKQN